MPLSLREDLLQTPVALPALPARNAHRRPHRRGRCHRTHPAPPRIVGSRCEGRCRPRPTGTRRAGHRTLARRSLPRLRPRTGVRRKLTTPAAARCALGARIIRHSMVRGAPQTTEWRELDSQSLIWQRPGMEITASSFKLWANFPEGRKRFPINSTKCIKHSKAPSQPPCSSRSLQQQPPMPTPLFTTMGVQHRAGIRTLDIL